MFRTFLSPESAELVNIVTFCQHFADLNSMWQHVAKIFQIVVERQAQGSTWAFQLWKFPLVVLVKVSK